MSEVVKACPGEPASPGSTRKIWLVRVMRRVVEWLSLPLVTFDELQRDTPHEMITWLENFGYFREFGRGAQVASLKERFIAQGLLGLVLLKKGYYTIGGKYKRQHQHKMLF